MSKLACKDIIDNGGANSGELLAVVEIYRSMALSLSTFGVAETNHGRQWLEDVAKYQRKTRNAVEDLKAEAMQLCREQPIE